MPWVTYLCYFSWAAYLPGLLLTGCGSLVRKTAFNDESKISLVADEES